jgi:hypothetical protein
MTVTHRFRPILVTLFASLVILGMTARAVFAEAIETPKGVAPEVWARIAPQMETARSASDSVLTNLETKLTASDKADSDHFGYSVSVAGDVALVGAERASPAGLSIAGAAYVFERNAGGANAWGQVAKLTASDKMGGDGFGISVSVAGDVALVGAYGSDPGSLSSAGAAYIFERNAGGTNAWGQVQKLTASDKAKNAYFGTSVSVAGDVALVGAYADAAYVFERNAGGVNAWGQVKKLTGSDTAASDYFGYTVSVAGDVALVGASGADPEGLSSAGAAYVFERNAGGVDAWGQVRKLTAADKAAGDDFGYSVSVDGDVALVGSPGAYAGGVYAGAAYVFERNIGGANAWGQVQKLTAADKVTGDCFGDSVSVAGDVAVVGADGADPGGVNAAGAAYVFERNAGGTNAWGQVSTLSASDKATSDYFGYSVCVAGDVVLAGAFSADPGGVYGAGAAYVIPFNREDWSEKSKLTAADKAEDDDFGYSVSVAGDVAVVGAYQVDPGWTINAGAAYVFERNEGGVNAWGQVAKLTASDMNISAYFGYSVSVAGDVALVGAVYADAEGTVNAGAAYVFERNAGGPNAWGEVAKLSASDKAESDYFGNAVSVAGDVALVGAYYASPEGLPYAGAAYVFERNAGGTNAWGEVAKLTATDKAAIDNFGRSVSVAGDVALVGANEADHGETYGAGAAYVFERNAGGANAWGQAAKLMASDKAESANFGISVSVAGDVALVGAYQASPEGTDEAGAAYVFERNAGGANAWNEVKRLTALDKTAYVSFGVSVSVAGDVALVGTAYAGSAYVFERNAGGANAWSQVKKLTASDKVSGDQFGTSVSVAGDVALVGASGASPEGMSRAGAAYVFEGLIYSNTASAGSEMTVLGTNGAIVASGEAASAAKGSDFGARLIGSSTTNSLSITNSGAAALTIGGCSTNGSGAAAFQILGLPAQIAAGSVSNFSVVFSPAGQGAVTVAVSIANSSTNTPYVVLLAGSGAPPVLTIRLEPDGAGDTTPPPGDYPVTANVATAIQASAHAGYRFTQWTQAGGGTIADADAASTTVTLASDSIVTASFTLNAITAVTDRASVLVPEGGSAIFNVRLSAQGTGVVAVTVARTSGDSDLSVSTGSNLTFTTANWATYQTVTLAAAEDNADKVAGTAVFTIAGAGIDSAFVTATEADDDYTLVVTAATNGTVTRRTVNKIIELPLYDNGTVVELTATADESYRFSGWSGQATGKVNPLAVTMDGDKSVTASFIPVTPVALPPRTIAKKSFTARWRWIKGGAPEGELSVASDTGFVNLVPGFEARYLCNITECGVTNLAANRDYWYRVRRLTDWSGASTWSKAVKVRTGKGLPVFPMLLCEAAVEKGSCQEFARTSLASGAGVLTANSSDSKNVSVQLTDKALLLHYRWKGAGATARITLTTRHPVTGYSAAYETVLSQSTGKLVVVGTSALTNAGTRVAQEITLENRTGKPVYGVRLRAKGLDNRAWMVNRSGFTLYETQEAIRELPCVWQAGSQLVVRVVFNSAYREQAKTRPVVYKAYVILPPPNGVELLTPEMAVASSVPYEDAGLWLLGLPAIGNRRYTVCHSDDDGVNWITNAPAIRATANYLMWLDLESTNNRVYEVQDAEK